MTISETDFVTQAQQQMQKSVDNCEAALQKLRTGRVHPQLLDQVKVNYYGQETALRNVASISVEDASMLLVTPWEKALVADIEKAIMMSDLGLNPSSMGTVVRVPIPPLTEERRRDLVKLAKTEGEKAKVAVRQVRRDLLSKVKPQVKAGELTKDDEVRLEAEVQKVTDAMVAAISSLVEQKEKDIMQV